MKQSFKISATVYSVVSIRSEDVERITDAYLYDHTAIANAFDRPDIVSPEVTAVVLKTTVSKELDIDPYDIYQAGIDSELRALCREAERLAHYQVDRFASGLYAGRVCGSEREAVDYIMSLVRA